LPACSLLGLNAPRLKELFGEEWAGVRTARFKYMRSEDGEERLFDVAGDPGEQVNVVASAPDALAALRALVR
jgi:hypothetical protein